MMTVLALLGGLYAMGILAFLFGMQRAPEAYEDEEGFHLVWRNNDPERADVACVWSLDAASGMA